MYGLMHFQNKRIVKIFYFKHGNDLENIIITNPYKICEDIGVSQTLINEYMRNIIDYFYQYIKPYNKNLNYTSDDIERLQMTFFNYYDINFNGPIINTFHIYKTAHFLQDEIDYINYLTMTVKEKIIII